MMGQVVLVLGDSGSGKSTSLRNFEPGEVGILNVMGKRLPFRKRLDTVDHPGYGAIQQALQRNRLRAYVIDDSGYLMQLENFRRAKENGYGKYTEMAQNFERLVEWGTQTDDDTIVYLLHHYDEPDANGLRRPKTIGKMLNEKFCIEGACPVVIESAIRDGRHVFITQGNGFNCAKAPMGMLPEVMDNDLKAVDAAIREYWGMAPLTDAADAAPGDDGAAQA